jgi:ketosteroid isomerase-like protein
MRRSKLLLVLACVAVVACTQDMTRREMLLEQESVQERVNSWVNTMNNARVDSLLLFYDAGAETHVVWPDGRMAKGFEAVEQTWRDFYSGTNYMNFALSQLEVRVLAHNVAQAVFRHSTDVVDANGQRAVFPGRGLVVLLKDTQDNVWKIQTQLLSVNRASEN